jgi:hypothetical protein
MHAYRIVWEDEPKAREVEIFVDYTIRDGLVQIESVRPTKVTLYDRVTRSIARELKVWTETGRNLLARAYHASREGMISLEEEILAQHELRDENLATEVA